MQSKIVLEILKRVGSDRLFIRWVWRRSRELKNRKNLLFSFFGLGPEILVPDVYFYRTRVRSLATLVKNSLTDSFMCLRIKWCDPGDNYAKSKLVFIGSLMTASDVRRDSWRSLSFVICQVKSNSFNPCVCDNVFIVQDWSSGDCWPSVNKRNIFPFQLRYMTWMADEYKCQTKYQGTNISCIEFFLPFNKLLQSFQKYIHFF